MVGFSGTGIYSAEQSRNLLVIWVGTLIISHQQWKLLWFFIVLLYSVTKQFLIY